MGSLLNSRLVWAQQNPHYSGGQDGYSITGSDKAKPDTAYVYNQQVLVEDPNVYWVVTGAKTIEGQPAANWPEGRLRVADYPQLTVVWEDSIPAGRLALRSVDASESSNSGTVQQRSVFWVAVAVFLYEETLCNPSIQWGYNNSSLHDFASDEATFPSANFCPLQINTLRFNLTFGGTCSGGAQPYEWTILYVTDRGHGYAERFNSADEEISYKFRTQVPQYPFNLNPSGGNAAYAYLSNANVAFPMSQLPAFTSYSAAAPATPYLGEKIVLVLIRVRGVDCGLFGTCGNLSVLSRAIYVALDPPVVAAQEIFPSGQLGGSIPANGFICAGRRYRLTARQGSGGTTTSWATDIGTITASGTTATLDLTSVNSSTVPFQVNVTATNSLFPSTSNCVADSSPATAAFLFGQTDEPQNLRMDNGTAPICGFPPRAPFGSTRRLIRAPSTIGE